MHQPPTVLPHWSEPNAPSQTPTSKLTMLIGCENYLTMNITAFQEHPAPSTPGGKRPLAALYLFALREHPHLSAISFARAVAAHKWFI